MDEQPRPDTRREEQSGLTYSEGTMPHQERLARTNNPDAPKLSHPSKVHSFLLGREDSKPPEYTQQSGIFDNPLVVNGGHIKHFLKEYYDELVGPAEDRDQAEFHQQAMTAMPPGEPPIVFEVIIEPDAVRKRSTITQEVFLVIDVPRFVEWMYTKFQNERVTISEFFDDFIAAIRLEEADLLTYLREMRQSFLDEAWKTGVPEELIDVFGISPEFLAQGNEVPESTWSELGLVTADQVESVRGLVELIANVIESVIQQAGQYSDPDAVMTNILYSLYGMRKNDPNYSNRKYLELTLRVIDTGMFDKLTTKMAYLSRQVRSVGLFLGGIEAKRREDELFDVFMKGVDVLSEKVTALEGLIKDARGALGAVDVLSDKIEQIRQLLELYDQAATETLATKIDQVLVGYTPES